VTTELRRRGRQAWPREIQTSMSRVTTD
jgi:hypothetical protein